MSRYVVVKDGWHQTFKNEAAARKAAEEEVRKSGDDYVVAKVSHLVTEVTVVEEVEVK